MKILNVANYEELSKKAAIIVLSDILTNPNLSICLASGSTPLGLYQELIKAHKELSIDFSGISTFNLDEYYPMTKDNPHSYYRFMFEHLFNHININPLNLNFLDGTTTDQELTCTQFEKKVRDKGIDLQILGIGANGHIGFNEQGSLFNATTRLVDLSEKTITDNARFFDSIDQVPKQALTMGISTIMSAKKILLLASGKNKAVAIKRLLEGTVDESCPASILQRHPNATLIADQEALSLLHDNVIPETIKGYHIVTQDNAVQNKKIIVVSPHPDDASICVGGTISLLAEQNDVHIFIMTTGHRSFIPNTTKQERIDLREKEACDESKILNTTPHHLRLAYYDNDKESLEKDIAKVAAQFHAIDPDIVFFPQVKDSHPTHQIARKIMMTIVKNYSKKIECWSYESPWGLFQKEGFNTIVSLPEMHLQRKINAIKTQKSQLSRTRYDVAAEALTRFRGALIPEQELAGYGKQPIRISNALELYYVETSDML